PEGPGHERNEDREPGDRRDDEPQRHGPFGALLGARARDRPLPLVVDDVDVVEGARELCAFLDAHVLDIGRRRGGWMLARGHDLAPSHIANPIIAAMPTMKATKPSDTGPTPPSGSPPGLLFPFVTDLT